MGRWALSLLLFLHCLSLCVLAQETANPSAKEREPSANVERDGGVEVSIITMGPGPLVYERFGHNGIRLHNPETGFDVLFDWGNFDFEEPNFIGKFVKGSLLYSMLGKSAEQWLDFYGQEQDRTIMEQVLNLDAQEKGRLRELLARNLNDPQYLYDYYLDNCSTRVRDALDATLQGQLSKQWQSPTPHSYRWHTRRLMDVGLDNKALSVLIDFGCGPRVDRPLSQWQAAFVPMELSRQLDSATIKRADGSIVPLVRERRQIHVTKLAQNAEPLAPPYMVFRTLPIGLGLGGLVLATSKHLRAGFWVLTGLWAAFAAFGTVFFVLLIAFTRHWVADWNGNFLQFSPASIGLLAAVIVPRWRTPLAKLPAVALGLSILGLAITIPAFQQNAPAVALALPLHAAVWLGWRPRQVSLSEPHATGSAGKGKDSGR